jgi:hypothetical protein
MRHRSRLPVALVALFTLLVSTTETLWASVCAPEMSGPRAAAEATAPAAHAEPGCAGEEAGRVPGPEDSQPDPEQQHCPLLALGGGGACVPSSLPSRATPQPDLWGGREALLPRAAAAPAPLFAPPPFHPPKA